MIEVEFRLSSSPLGLTRWNPQALDPLERPWHEQEIARPSLDRAGSGKEKIGETVANACQSKLVNCSGLPKKVDYLQRATPVALRVVKPS